MSYWLFIDKRTGLQVEWSDELACWLTPFEKGAPVEDERNHEYIEMVRVELTNDRYPITTDDHIGYPEQPYGEDMPPHETQPRTIAGAVLQAVPHSPHA